MNAVTPELLILVAGTIVGFVAGRWWSEIMRGRHDARRVWRGRRDYRRRR